MKIAQNKAFGRSQSFVAGPPKNRLQFMVKGSRKYASTGGWRLAQFDDGEPADAVGAQNLFCLPPCCASAPFCLHPLRAMSAI